MNPPDRRLQSKEGSVDTILVVEDSRPMQRTLQRLFEADGLRVQIASDGIAGLESFRKQTPDAATAASGPPAHELLTFGDTRIDFTSMVVTRAGKTLAFTAQEFKLLKYFARCPARVISRQELLNEVWGY